MSQQTAEQPPLTFIVVAVPREARSDKKHFQEFVLSKFREYRIRPTGDSQHLIELLNPNRIDDDGLVIETVKDLVFPKGVTVAGRDSDAELPIGDNDLRKALLVRLDRQLAVLQSVETDISTLPEADLSTAEKAEILARVRAQIVEAGAYRAQLQANQPYTTQSPYTYDLAPETERTVSIGLTFSKASKALKPAEVRYLTVYAVNTRWMRNYRDWQRSKKKSVAWAQWFQQQAVPLGAAVATKFAVPDREDQWVCAGTSPTSIASNFVKADHVLTPGAIYAVQILP